MNTGSGQNNVIDPNMAKYFSIDALNAINILENLNTKINKLDKKETDLYIVTVHGMKSALANINEWELSDMAHKLEMAGMKPDIGIMSAETSELINALKSLTVKFKQAKEANDFEISGTDLIFLHEKLSEIKTACAAFNVNTVKAALNDLRQMKWPDHVETVLDDISSHILHSKFNKAAEIADNAAKKIDL
jgi:HPt (histidine-containing phosphotransfer) domain-containing protein